MKHFTRAEWTLFLSSMIGQAKQEEMENHLNICDSCLEIYLEIIEDENHRANYPPDSPPVAISSDFADRVMMQVMGESQVMKKKKEAAKKHNLILYYTAAACITLFFVGSGFFNLLTSSIPQAATQILDTTRQTERIVASGWTERLLFTELEFKVELKFLDWGVNDGEEK